MSRHERNKPAERPKIESVRIHERSPLAPRSSLDGLVSTTRAEERARVERAIAGRSFNPGRSDALDGLRHLEGPTLGALARSLPAGAVVRWLGQRSGEELSRARREVLEVLHGAEASALRELDAKLLAQLDLVGLSPREERQLVDVILRLPEAKVREVLRAPNASTIRDVFRRRDALYTDADCRADERHALAVELAHAETRAGDAARLANDPALSKTLEAHTRGLLARRADARDAERALTWLAGQDEATLGTLARALDARGALERLIELTPEPARFGEQAPHREVFLALLRQRSPEKNLAASESLLTTNFLHRSVSPRHARLAYDLVRSLPLELQRRFREGERGAWFLRLERALDGETIRSSTFRGIDVSGGDTLVDVGARHAELLAEPGPRVLLEGLCRTLGPKPTAATARAAHARLSAIEDPEVLRAVVRRLDTLGQLEPMLRKIGYAALLEDERRLATLAILAARDPVHLAAHARRHLSLGTFDWSITNGDAFFALHLIKSLPERERKNLLAEDGGRWWRRVEDRLTGGMRQLPTTHFYTGGPEGRDLDALRAQLMRPEVWRGEHPEQRNALVLLAQAAGDGRFVFEASKANALHETAPEMVERYGLYHPQRRPNYQAPAIDRVRYFDEGPLGVLNDVALKILDTAVVIGRAHLSDFVGVSGVSVDALETGFRRRARQLKDVKLTLKTDPIQGLIEVDAPRIALNHFDAFREQCHVDAGGVAIEGLKVRAHYPTKKNPKPAYLCVEIASLEVRDAVVADPDRMHAATQLRLSGVRYIQASPAESDEGLSDQIRSLRLPIPVLGRVSGAVARILDLVFSGGISAGSARQLGDPLGPTRQALEIARAEVTGLVDTQGRGFERLELEAARLAGGGSLSALLRATGATEEAIADALHEETELAELEAARRRAVPLDASAKRRLVDLEHKIGHAGYALDVRRVVVESVRSPLEAQRITLSGVKGTVDTPTLGFRLIQDPQFLEDLLAAPSDSAWRDARGRLEVEVIDIEGPKSERVLPALEDLEARPEGVPPARRALEALEAKGLRALTSPERAEYVALSDALLGPPAFSAERLTLEAARLDLAPSGQSLHFGRATLLRAQADSGASAEVKASEVEVQLRPEGAQVGWRSAEASALELRVGTTQTVAIGWAGVDGLSARLERRSGASGFALGRVGVDHLEVGDVTARLEFDLDSSTPPLRRMVLEPLAGLNGVITARTPLGAPDEKSQARAELTLRDGQLDPASLQAAVDLEARGFFGRSRPLMGDLLAPLFQPLGRPRVGAEGLVVGPGAPLRWTLLDPQRHGGLHADRGLRGALDLREWAEHRSAQTAEAPRNPGKEPREIEVATRDLQLGGGRVEVGDLAFKLREGPHGIDLASRLGSRCHVYAQRLAADDLAWSGPEAALHAGAVALDDAELALATERGAPARLQLSLDQAALERLEFSPRAR